MSQFVLDDNIEAAIVFRAQAHLNKPYPNYEHYYLLHHIFNITEDDNHDKLIDLVLGGTCPFYMFKNISINLINAIQSKPCKCLLALYCSFANLPIKSLKCQQLAVQHFDDLMQYLLKQQLLPAELKLFLASCLEFQLVPKPYIMTLSKHIQYSLPSDTMQSSPSLLNVLLTGSSSSSFKIDLKPTNISKYLQDNQYSMKSVGILLQKYVSNPLDYQFDAIKREVLAGKYVTVDLQDIISGIDVEAGQTNSSEAGNVLDIILELSHKLSSAFPLPGFVNKQWKHAKTQAIYVLLLCVKEIELSGIKKITDLSCKDLSKISKRDDDNRVYIGLHYFPIFENCMILGTNFFPEMLEDMIKNYTDMFLLGSIQFNEGYNLFSALVPQYLQHPLLPTLLADKLSHNFINTWLMEIYQQSPTHLKRTLQAVFLESPTNVNQLVAISQPPLQYDLVCWFIDQVDLWLKEQIFSKKDEAMKPLIDLIQSKTAGFVNRNMSEVEIINKLGPSAVVPLTVANVRAIKNVLGGYKGFELSPSTQKFVLEVMDKLSNLQSALQPSPVTAEIESEARALFSRLFRDKYPPEQLVTYLLGTTSSPNGNQLLLKVVHLLLQEQSYFHQYPRQELEISSEFLGHLIAKNAVQGSLYSEATKLLVTCLAQPTNTNLFIFAHRVVLLGIHVLQKDVEFIKIISSIPNITQNAPDIFSFILQPSYQQPPPYDKSSKSQSKGLDAIRLFPALVSDKKKEVENVAPPEQLQDKILFVINNLSPSNIEIKTKEILKLINAPTTLRWLSHYVVSKRAVLEPNFHDVYLSFLVRLCGLLDLQTLNVNENLLDTYIKEHCNRGYYHSHMLWKFVLYESFEICKKLLETENAESREKGFIKSIGAWIGLLTIAKDKPLIHIHLNLKKLLLESLEKSKIQNVIPFTCKLLEQSKFSQIFKLPNPFIQFHLKFLKELYEFADMKQGLKLDIEILFKNLNLEMTEFEPTFLLPGRYRVLKPDEYNDQISNALNDLQLSEHSLNMSSNEHLESTIPPNFEHSDHYQNGTLQKLLFFAIDKSVKEILAPVVERSVTIASISTRELISKDFRKEKDLQKVHRAAQLMVTSLAGSLSMVTCKEPLRLSIMTNLKTLVVQQGIHQLNENEMIQLIDEQIDRVCVYIEQQAKEKAVLAIDINSIKQAIEENQRHNFESGNKSDYIINQLPAQLRSNTGVSSQQFKIYESFGTDELLPPTPASPINNASEFLITVTQDICKGMVSGVTGLEYQNQYRQIKSILAENTQQDQILLRYLEYLLKLLYSHKEDVVVTFLCGVLKEVCDLSKAVIKEFTSWFYMSENKLKFQIQPVMALMACGLVSISDVDVQLYYLLDDDFFIQFAKDFIKELLHQEEDVLLLELNQTIKKLGIFNEKELLAHTIPEHPLDSELVSAYYAGIFAKWSRLTQITTWNKDISNLFVHRTLDVLESDEKLIHFIRIALEMSIDNYDKVKLTLIDFCSIDALSIFIIEVLAVKKLRSQHVSMFGKIIACISMVLIHYHERSKMKFNQKGFTRLFCNLISGVHENSALHSDFSNSMAILAETFHTIQPQVVPGFAFGWLCLISHRKFIPSMLGSKSSWENYQKLIIDLLYFLLPFLRDPKMNEAVRLIYKGTLRLLLVLLHDYPEFLCCYYYNFCEVIPSICIQLKNLLLSCFPRDLRLPGSLYLFRSIYSRFEY
eukprot:NODE_40_length_35084_cov_0.543519.p1 type:complete len:1702 gc:universal NODE_40_length_35084_cov_0.543519:22557-27662(+)